MSNLTMTTKFGGLILSALAICASAGWADDPWVVYQGHEGPGAGKHVVLIAGDEEYRSEETLPMLAKILAVHHGFKCTVLFAINPEDGTIDPMNANHIPGLQHLRTADMVILATRFRELPDEDMRYFDEYVNSGKPILGLRTATHAFSYAKNKDSAYAKYDWRSTDWPGGFGRQVLGDTWINHHGKHNVESTRGVINPAFKEHPILKGVADVWGPTDVYGIKNLVPEARVLMFGQVLEGMSPTDKPVVGPQNDPMIPLVWIKTFTGSQGKVTQAICTTMGAAVDFKCEDLRRLVVNAVYWATGLADKIPAKACVDPIGTFEPTYFGFGKFIKGVKPSDLKL